MEDTGSKLITDLGREAASWSVEFETAYSNHSNWLSEATKAGESRILDLTTKPRKKAKVEKENSHPNKVSDVSEDGFGVKKRGSREADRGETSPALDVWSLKVADLRKELRSRNMDTRGRKLDLQERLAEALESEARAGDVESHEDEASPSVAAAEEHVEQPDSKLPSSGSASHPQDMEIDEAVGSAEVRDYGKGHAQLSGGPVAAAAAAASSPADGVVEIEMEDVNADANPSAENVTEALPGRSSFAASVTNEMSQLSVDHEDRKVDAVPLADAAKPSPEAIVIDDQEPSIRPESRGADDKIPEDADGPSALSSKKKKTLGNVLKATAKMFSPKRGNTKAKSTRFDSSDVNTEVDQTGDQGNERGREIGASSRSEKDISGDRIVDDKDPPSNTTSQPKHVVQSAKVPPFSSQTNLTTPHHKDPHLSSLSTSQGAAKSKPTKPSVRTAKPTMTKMSNSSISSGTSTSSSHSSASHSSSASRRVEEMRKKAERMKSEQRSGKGVPLKKNVPSSVSNNSAAYKALEDKKKANEVRKDQQRAHLAKLRGEMREQAKTNINKGSNALAQKAPALASHHTVTSATAMSQVPGNDVRGPGAAERSASRTRVEESSRTGVAPAPSTATQDKKKMLAAKMREKAAAQTQKRIAAETQNRKAAAPTKSATAEPTKKPAALAAAKQAPSFAKQQQDTMVLKLQQEHDLRQQQQQQQQKQQPQQQQQQPQKKQQQKQSTKAPSPMDTYEMSEKEYTDSSEEESDSDDQSQPRKRVPTWAQKPNLMNALEKQFSLSNPERIDPDAVFGEVHTCDLEEIFDQKKSRYARRTSSGNWTQDKVTVMEKLTYKRTMGFESPP